MNCSQLAAYIMINTVIVYDKTCFYDVYRKKKLAIASVFTDLINIYPLQGSCALYRCITMCITLEAQ